MKILNGFEVPENCSIVPDYILMGVDIRTVVSAQIDKTYIDYLVYKSDEIEKTFNKDIGDNWKDRSDDDCLRLSYYIKELKELGDIIKSINESREVEKILKNEKG